MKTAPYGLTFKEVNSSGVIWPCGHAHFNLVAFPIGPFTTSTFTTSALQLALQEQSHENSCF